MEERPVLLIIDMVKDNLDESRPVPITPLARKLFDPINRLTKAFRKASWPVVFATDAFEVGGFIFKGKMKPSLGLSSILRFLGKVGQFEAYFLSSDGRRLLTGRR